MHVPSAAERRDGPCCSMKPPGSLVPKAGSFSTPGVTASAPAQVGIKTKSLSRHEKSQKKRFNSAFEGKKFKSAETVFARECSREGGRAWGREGRPG
jgi:hypothetical protein